MRVLLVAVCLLLTALAAAPGAAAMPPHDDCDNGVVLGGSFTGYCGDAPDCMLVYVHDIWTAMVGCR